MLLRQKHLVCIFLFLVFQTVDFMSGFACAWQEDGVDLVTTIKGAGYYRRGRIVDYVSDFIPPTTIEVNKVYEEYR